MNRARFAGAFGAKSLRFAFDFRALGPSHEVRRWPGGASSPRTPGRVLVHLFFDLRFSFIFVSFLARESPGLGEAAASQQHRREH